MKIYLITLIILIILMIVSKVRLKIGHVNIRFENIVFFLSFVMLFVIGAARSGIGTDYKTYIQAFDLFTKGIYPWWLNYEPGFIFLNWSLARITNNSQWLILITSFLVLIIFFKTCKKNSTDVIFSIFLFYTLYFYFTSFNIIRQSIAVLLTFYAIDNIIKDDIKGYLKKILIASFCFHSTALIMVPFYFIAKKRVKLYIFIVGAVLSTVLVFLYDYIMAGFVYMFPKYESYINYASSGAKLNIIFLFINLIILLFIRNFRIDKNDKKTIKVFNIYTNACSIGLMFSLMSPLNIIFSRIALYFYIYSTISIPCCLVFFVRKERVIVKICIGVLALFMFTYYLINNIAGVVPYNSIIL